MLCINVTISDIIILHSSSFWFSLSYMGNGIRHEWQGSDIWYEWHIFSIR